ncbi:MAG: flagellin [Candidatus Binatia bacterium]
MDIKRVTSSLLISQDNKTQNRLKKVFTQLATGKRINSASDDAATLSIITGLEKQVRGFKTVENNIGDALNALNISDGAASSISNMLQRQRELAVQAANATLNSEDRDILNREFQALAQEIDRVANTANFNGQTLLNGSSPLSDGTGTVQVDPSSDPANQITVSETDLTAESLEIENLDISNGSNSSQAITALDNAAKQVNAARSSQGAIANRLQHAHNSAVVNRQNTTHALSRAEDLDFAKAVSDQVRETLLAQTKIETQKSFFNIARNSLIALIQQK